jgi:hypothetical protein
MLRLHYITSGEQDKVTGDGMSKKRKKRITVETERILIVRRGRSSVRAWCEKCGQQVQMVTAEAAATLAGVSRRTIYRWVEADKLHFTETLDGLLLICLDSLHQLPKDTKSTNALSQSAGS